MIVLIFLAAIGYGIYFYFYKTFAIKLLSPGPNPLRVMQIIKNATEWGLTEAKNITDNMPWMLSVSHFKYFKTRKILSELKEAGASAQFVVHYFWQKALPDGPID